jgi:hypothetical protein
MSLPLIVPDWPAPANVRAAMTTRAGGVSTGACASLNLGFGAEDARANVVENRRRLRAALQLPEEPRWLQQVHGTTVVRLTAPFVKGGGERSERGIWEIPPDADASYTTEPGMTCVVMAADCLPVLFCDDAGTVVAAAHAGWRGLAAGVLEATVRALPVPPGRLMAWLGAAIGPESFEVGAEVRDAFVSRMAEADRAFAPRAQPGKYLADLYLLARQRLGRAGVTQVHGGGACTLREPGRFFSYRRDGRCGRMAALIRIERRSH